MGHADVTTAAIYIRPEAARAALDPRAIIGPRRSVDGGAEAAAAVLN
jgi:hypothetical protein